MRLFITAFMLILALSALGYYFWYRPKFIPHRQSHSVSTGITDENKVELIKLKQKAALLTDFINKNKYDPGYCFMVDMHIASGKKRFFVYNLNKDSIELSGLVTHGSGSDKGGTELVFSNIPNSNCTSLGRYRIADPYNGKFGLAYKLQGLDKTNDKAFERFVVLHAHSCVPEEEVYPLGICESLGCPTVSPSFLLKLKTYIDRTEKPVLLWIFY